MTYFEYDPKKSCQNLEKHGIDFVDARELWNDPGLLVAKTMRGGEPRYVALSRMFGACWLMVYVWRGDAIRIISVRRATRKEAAEYDKANR